MFTSAVKVEKHVWKLIHTNLSTVVTSGEEETGLRSGGYTGKLQFISNVLFL